MRLLDQNRPVRAGCHAEGRGFESLHPLHESPATARFLVVSAAGSTRVTCTHSSPLDRLRRRFPRSAALERHELSAARCPGSSGGARARPAARRAPAHVPGPLRDRISDACRARGAPRRAGPEGTGAGPADQGRDLPVASHDCARADSSVPSGFRPCTPTTEAMRWTSTSRVSLTFPTCPAARSPFSSRT